MFWIKQRREADKLIRGEGNLAEESDDPSAIAVKIGSREQLFSSYSYSGDKLNTEFSEYIFDKAKDLPVKEEIKIKIFTEVELDSSETERALKNHYRTVYKDSCKEIKRISFISAIMTVLGLIALSILILVNRFLNDFFVTSIVEIAAWVFIWEAVDYFFLQRPAVKAKCILIQRIYAAQIVVCKTDAVPTGE